MNVRSGTTMIDSLVKAFVSCSHRKLSFPITVKHDARLPGCRFGSRTYVTCLDCGTELPYSWDEMRIERAVPAVLGVRVRQLASWFESVRVALSKGIRLDVRCRITRGGEQGDWTWRIRIGRSSRINFTPASPKCTTVSTKNRATLAGISSSEPSSISHRFPFMLSIAPNSMRRKECKTP
jgi:hypothetical protein